MTTVPVTTSSAVPSKKTMMKSMNATKKRCGAVMPMAWSSVLRRLGGLRKPGNSGLGPLSSKFCGEAA